MKNLFQLVILLFCIIGLPLNLAAKEKPVQTPVDSIKSSTFSGLKFRSIGPAFTSGRISCLAVNPANNSEYYVGVASGNLWKTNNAGITFEPVFDNYGSYSIGAITMDPNNHNVLWLGTGENNHQRALGYGDGVYRTADGGKSWENMGLKNSRQIGGIVVDYKNSDVVFVAAEGSVWGPGGDRGLYKTTDGGKTWKKVLAISDETGVNNIVMHPLNHNILFATSEQRRRHIFTKIGGGPETAFYKSTDNGETWRKITSGLPSVEMGGSGIAISPSDPDYVYLIIEAAGKEGGFFRSTDRGESWEKMSSYVSSGQYFNTIVCDPVNKDKVYSLETVSMVTLDGGKNWKSVGNDNRHVDDHTLWIDPSDTQHFLIGGDGGLYESFDGGKKFLFKSNLPVTQFYRVGLDNAYPFYNIYGGTQDNNTFGGPSGNLKTSGVSSEEWFTVVGGDGFWVQIDPTDPNIVYCEYQYGNVYRYDKKSEELLYIKPQPAEDELTFKWNWNSPLILSSHSNSRIYIAANKIFRSDDKGQSWKEFSGDITTQTDRNTWPVMGYFWSSDAVAKDLSTSLWGTAVSLEESPVNENLVFAGTDDGVLSITEDAGKTWRMIKTFAGIPEYTYVSDILASNFDENVLYVSFDNTQRDDFKPYILMSSDKGKSWKSVTSNLPARGTVHCLEQDFLNPNLIFAGTEFGIFVTFNGGSEWIQLTAGIPTISIRDIAIQKRENDLVLATFGRGFYVLDDYSSLRKIAEDPKILKSDSYVFPVSDALLYLQTGGKYGQGATLFNAPNQPYGAQITYYLKESPKTLKQIRTEKEKELFKNKQTIPQLTQEMRRAEEMEEPPYLLFTISDTKGNVVRKIPTAPGKGINRFTWDLRYSSLNPAALKDNKFDPLSGGNSGISVVPGEYTVTAQLIVRGESTPVGNSVTFKSVALNNQTLPASDKTELLNFQKKIADVAGTLAGIIRELQSETEDLARIRQTLAQSTSTSQEIILLAGKTEASLKNLIYKISGPEAKASSEELPPMILPAEQRLGYLTESSYSSTSVITETQKDALKILEKQVPEFRNELIKIKSDIETIKKEMDSLKLPWTPGRF